MMNDHKGSVELVKDFRDCFVAVKDLIERPTPTFIARIGGSDADAVAEYFTLARTSGPAEALNYTLQKFGIVKLFNGYYDRSGDPAKDDPAKVERFCQVMIECYLESSDVFIGGSSWLTEFFPEHINPVFQVDTSEVKHLLHALVAAIGARQQPARFYPYPFVENLLNGPHTLFRVFAETLSGRRVLAATPFAESIKFNFHRRRHFFPGYVYPEFNLVTYDTPITYHGLPAEFYPDMDWFATLERMKAEISLLKFDIALLSCGSYAMPLGLYISNVMQRKAIYVGGCLQLYFGITGRRYDDPFFIDQINPGEFILPVERDRFLPHVKVGPQTAKDAFGAYF
jgi:hypothetical protein